MQMIKALKKVINRHQNNHPGAVGIEILPQNHIGSFLDRLAELQETMSIREAFETKINSGEMLKDSSPLWNNPHLVALCSELFY